jgi:hypothetical protein
LNRKSELLLSTVLTILVFIGVVKGFPPFGNIMDLGENLKEGWEKEWEAPPVPHAEEFSIAQLSGEILQVPDSILITRLNKLGIEVTSAEETLKELALQVDLSPQQIYRELSPGGRGSGSRAGGRGIQPGGGLGRKSLQQVASENDLVLEEMLLLLENKGIFATGDDIIRDLADDYGVSPSEILTILNGGESLH